MTAERITFEHIVLLKSRGEKVTMLTAYDFPLARLLDQAGVDIILVGDSLANVVLGLPSTKDVGMTEMLHHAKAVRRAVTRALLVGDLPYAAAQTVAPAEAAIQARRFIDEAGCDAVKVEWFDGCLDVIEILRKDGVAVMGHVGLTPQTADKLGGFKVQGKDEASAKTIMEQARLMTAAGCFALVLECVPDALARRITAEIPIPTIGIGAGPGCDGQVLVLHDLLGLYEGHRPKFVKQYAQLSQAVAVAVGQYVEEVRQGTFPDAEHSYGMPSKD